MLEQMGNWTEQGRGIHRRNVCESSKAKGSRPNILIEDAAGREASGGQQRLYVSP